MNSLDTLRKIAGNVSAVKKNRETFLPSYFLHEEVVSDASIYYILELSHCTPLTPSY